MRAISLAAVVLLGVACAPPLAPGSPSAPTVQAEPSADAAAASPTPGGPDTRSPGSTPARSSPPTQTAGQPAARTAAMAVDRSGDELVVTISGLMPDERVELIVQLVLSAFATPIAADGDGDARVRVPLRGDSPVELKVRRASGEDLRAAFAPPPGGPTAPGLAASLPPPSVSPSVASPSVTLAARAAVPFAVALEPADPPPGSTPEIVVTGLLAGEAFDLEVGVTGGGTDTYGVQADTAGSFRWRSPVIPGIGFRATAVRRTGERASTALAAVATATPTPTPNPTVCPASGADPARTGVDGYVHWGGEPVSGIRVELSGYLFSPDRDVLYGSAVTRSDGYYAVTGVPRAGVFYDLDVPAQAPYLARAISIVVLCPDRLTRNTLDFALVRGITGLSVRDGLSVAAGPLDLAWQPSPRAAFYCVAVWPNALKTDPLTSGRCGGRDGAATASLNSFRTPALVAGGNYTICVWAQASDDPDRVIRGLTELAEGCAKFIEVR